MIVKERTLLLNVLILYRCTQNEKIIKIIKQNIYRAHFSSLAPSELRKAFNKLGKPDKNQSDAVDARKVLDLKIGVAFTRYQTRFFKEKYGQLNERSLISYGPCQTPTLGFVVKRNDERAWFKSEKYWTINIECNKSKWRHFYLN